MRIVVDGKNNVCFGFGHAYGKTIKAVVKRHPDDNWDENFGKEALKRKFKIREVMAQRDWHSKELSYYKRQIEWCKKMMDYETEIVDRLNDKINNMQAEYSNDFVK